MHQFLAERYGIKDAKKMEPFVGPFQWMLHNLPERVAAESVDNSSYPIILFFSHFGRDEIRAFEERISSSLYQHLTVILGHGGVRCDGT